jgi:predicted AAA+ superfamily ATPase
MSVTRQWVEKLCRKCGASLEWSQEAADEAILWSQKKGDRSGRIAYQFASNWVGRNLLGE